MSRPKQDERGAPTVMFRYRLHPQPAFEYVSPSIWALTGHAPEEFYADFSLALQLVHPDDRNKAERQLGPQAVIGEPITIRALLDDGTTVWTEQRASGVYDDQGELVAVEGILRDVTARVRAEQACEHIRAGLEQRIAECTAALESANRALSKEITRRARMEQQLRHSQKMEIVGTLASGIAHDFNNVLTAIIGCADLALRAVAADSTARPHLEELKHVARTGAGIVRQLMDLGRKTDGHVRVTDLSGLLNRSQVLLRCLLGKKIALELQLTISPAPVRCDASQLEQVIMNLVVNARQAMPRGGRLRITTSDAEIDGTETHARTRLTPGRYVTLTVTDTGHGIDEATQERLFDAFFTTKRREQGTGLGLSTVRAIVTGCGGDVCVTSQPGCGSTFTLWFPWCREPIETEVTPPVPQRGSGETVLVAEDEPLVRLAVRSYLEHGGYRVVEASDGHEAKRLLREREIEIDLLVTDVVLPGESGQAVVAAGRARRPSLPVVYMSAYPAATLEESREIPPDAIAVQKPFEEQALLTAVQQAIEHSRSPRGERVAPTATSSKMGCLLLVEDDATARVTCCELLNGSGFDVLAAENAETALRMFYERAGRIDALVADVGLPNMTGLEMVAQLRSEKPELAVLLLSGWSANDPMFADVLHEPHTAFLQKPVDVEKLVGHIRKLLNS